MARKPRGPLPGGIYHVYSRGNDRRPVFLDDADRRAYLEALAEECEDREWVQLAYCNPVEAGLCKTPADWSWTDCAAAEERSKAF